MDQVAGGPGRAGPVPARRPGELRRQLTAAHAGQGMPEQGSPHHGDLRPGCPCPWPAAGRRRRPRSPPGSDPGGGTPRAGSEGRRPRGYGLSAITPASWSRESTTTAGRTSSRRPSLVQGDGQLGGRPCPAGEDHVPALDVGGDLGVAERSRDLPQVRHRHPVATGEVDRAQQGNVGPHVSILPRTSCVTSFPENRRGITGGHVDLDRRLDPEIAAALALLPIIDLSDIPTARETMLARRAAAAADAQPSPTVVRRTAWSPG